MKNLSIFFVLLTAFIFAACSDDDKATLVTSFEGKLTEENSEFISESKTVDGSYYIDSFKDSSNQLSFTHYYNDWGYGYTFAGFTYTNYTDNSSSKSIAAITKKGKIGDVYLSACTNDYTPAEFTINNPEVYKIKGAWVTNCTWAYNSMTVGDGYADPFVKGSYFILKATGYGPNNTQTGTTEIYLANYSSDNDKPVSDWIWFDMTELSNAVKVKFSLSSTNNDPEWGMKTASYFCMDGITLEEK